jgi:hypothetical protein
MRLLPRLERVEKLVKRALTSANAALSQLLSFGTPFSAVLTIPDSGAPVIVLSVPVTTNPIILETTYMFRDHVLERNMYSTQRSEVNLNTPFVTTQSEFQVIQPGLANPPTINVPVINGTNVDFSVTNPIAGNPIDLQVVSVRRIAPI